MNTYLKLIRWHRPVGTLLLLWPTWVALWAAQQGVPDWTLWFVFTLGAFLMRSAGCVINDICDRDIDRQVTRTQSRPLAVGELSLVKAVSVALILISIAGGLVLWLYPHVLGLALFALPIITIYPLSKRFLKIPQLVLGVAFAWPVPMGYMAIQGNLSSPEWGALMVAIWGWVNAFDTQYALSDIDDDRHLPIYTAPKFFKGQVKSWIIACQSVTLISLGVWTYWSPMGSIYTKIAGLFCLGAGFICQHQWPQLPQHGQRLFLMNQWWGMGLWLWLVLMSVEQKVWFILA